ncbi:hypothetical protein C8R44DRAFT_887826 [Mycena epipterygia]|nr:hypothetical protein C8R44DRAFT_887826 [Mycena epipterygia]
MRKTKDAPRDSSDIASRTVRCPHLPSSVHEGLPAGCGAHAEDLYQLAGSSQGRHCLQRPNVIPCGDRPPPLPPTIPSPTAPAAPLAAAAAAAASAVGRATDGGEEKESGLKLLAAGELEAVAGEGQRATCAW